MGTLSWGQWEKERGSRIRRTFRVQSEAPRENNLGRGQESPCASLDSAVGPPAGESFLQSHLTSPPRTAEVSAVRAVWLSHRLLRLVGCGGPAHLFPTGMDHASLFRLRPHARTKPHPAHHGPTHTRPQATPTYPPFSRPAYTSGLHPLFSMTTPNDSRRPWAPTTPLVRPGPCPGSQGVGGPPTCAEGNWGTASRSRPCSWEWMLARARWDSVSLCRNTGREEYPMAHSSSPLLSQDTELGGPCAVILPALLHPVPWPAALTC